MEQAERIRPAVSAREKGDAVVKASLLFFEYCEDGYCSGGSALVIPRSMSSLM